MKKKVLIFVIAYYAEDTLRAVLERIPRSIFDEYDCEILVVDDASEDRTYAIGREYKEHHPDVKMTVLRNEINQGYGGNQKVGYTFAIHEGFDYVAMVHGDGQYAPEELPRLVAPLRDGLADAVFGSRMMTRFGALKGRMPLYKWLGNKILTHAQNSLLGTQFTEFHSGYRIYSTRALARIRFLLNSNDFHFDTEIILQLLNASARILELPIPTYYGNEICRVNGMNYAKNVMVATLRNAIHRTGLLEQRKFDPVDVECQNARYGLKLGYPSSHSYALSAVPDGALVLDIGSGPGGMSTELLRKGCSVGVVDKRRWQDDDPRITFYEQDLDEPIAFDVNKYDYLLLMDIIEHVDDPDLFLERLRGQFDWSSKTLVLTTPNIAFIVQRVMLLLGHFNYGKQGILDRTHKRLFTFRGVAYLLADAGFRITEVRGVPAPFPKVLGNGWLGKCAIRTNLALMRLSRELFSYQIFVVAKSTPDVAFVLRDARERSESRSRKATQNAGRGPARETAVGAEAVGS